MGQNVSKIRTKLIKIIRLTGALTSKPYAFLTRPWELRSVPSLDLLDGVGSHVRVDFKEAEILRILPRRNPDINDSWISDKGRHYFDGLKRQRLSYPFYRKKKKLNPFKWHRTLTITSRIFKVYTKEFGNNCIGILLGSSLDTESYFAARRLSLNFGFTLLGSEKSPVSHIDFPQSYKFQTSIKDLDTMDYCLFVGTNPRYEASSLNLRFRKAFWKGNTEFDSIGGFFSSNYSVGFQGLGVKQVISLGEGKHPLCKKILKAKKAVILFGNSLLQRIDKEGLGSLLNNLKTYATLTSNNCLHSQCNSVGNLEMGITSKIQKNVKELKVLYTVGYANKKALLSEFDEDSLLKIFQDSHGDHFSRKSDFLFPATTFTEKSALYFNIEGRPQLTETIIHNSSLARDDWKIFQVLTSYLGKSMNYDSNDKLRFKLSKVLPSSFFKVANFGLSDNVIFNSTRAKKNRKICLDKSFYKLVVEDFFMTHSVCKASNLMAKASKFLRTYSNNYNFLSSK